MQKIYILTTAVCRPRLHRQCLKPVLDALKPWHSDVTWLVNVDPVPVGSDALVKKTMVNFERMGSSLDEVKVMSPAEGACFYLAVKRLAEAVERKGLQDNDLVIYLEDDWKMQGSGWLEDLESLREKPRSYSRSLRSWGDRRDVNPEHKAVYLSPGLWSGGLFRMAFRPAFGTVDDEETSGTHHSRENLNVRDPEKVVNIYSKSLSNSEFWDYRVLPARDDFVDRGRQWIAKQPYMKWRDKGQDFDSVSYIHIGWPMRIRRAVSRAVSRALGRHRSKNP